MSIEMGARGGMIAPDDTTFDYMRGRQFAPQGTDFDKKVAEWRKLKTDDGAVFDKELYFKAEDIKPWITYGTNPGMGIGVDGHVPNLNEVPEKEQLSYNKSLAYQRSHRRPQSSSRLCERQTKSRGRTSLDSARLKPSSPPSRSRRIG
jgi:3-isopropylmalate/(R)-2-methylmalate dehydratase large subunit